MEELVDMFAENLFWVLGAIIVIVAIGGGYVRDIIKIRAQERTRREIAAYIAEGTMNAEQGERLMKAAADKDE